MSVPNRDELEAFALTSSTLLGLKIDRVYLTTVIDNLEVVFRHYEIVSAQPLTQEIEPAFVFRP